VENEKEGPQPGGGREKRPSMKGKGVSAKPPDGRERGIRKSGAGRGGSKENLGKFQKKFENRKKWGKQQQRKADVFGKREKKRRAAEAIGTKQASMTKSKGRVV